MVAVRFVEYKPCPKGYKVPLWEFICDCGRRVMANKYLVRKGHTTSCGCYKLQRVQESHTKHGHCKGPKPTAMYQAFRTAIQRCTSPKVRNYSAYGGRGIKFEFESFEEFVKALGDSWKPGLSLDRKDNDGNYNAKNCKWSTSKEQARNRRDNHFLQLGPLRFTVAEWAERLKINVGTLHTRLKFGWSDSDTLTKPLRRW